MDRLSRGCNEAYFIVRVSDGAVTIFNNRLQLHFCSRDVSLVHLGLSVRSIIAKEDCARFDRFFPIIEREQRGSCLVRMTVDDRLTWVSLDSISTTKGILFVISNLSVLGKVGKSYEGIISYDDFIRYQSVLIEYAYYDCNLVISYCKCNESTAKSLLQSLPSNAVIVKKDCDYVVFTPCVWKDERVVLGSVDCKVDSSISLYSLISEAKILCDRRWEIERTMP